MDGVLTDQGFSRSCGRTDHHGMALVQSVDRLQLKVIQRERKQLRRIRRPSLYGL